MPSAQGVLLVGVVRHEPLPPNPSPPELRRNVKLPCIALVAQLLVRLVGVKPLILQVVGFELFHQSNAPSLLPGTTQHRHLAPTRLSDVSVAGRIASTTPPSVQHSGGSEPMALLLPSAQPSTASPSEEITNHCRKPSPRTILTLWYSFGHWLHDTKILAFLRPMHRPRGKQKGEPAGPLLNSDSIESRARSWNSAKRTTSQTWSPHRRRRGRLGSRCFHLLRTHKSCVVVGQRVVVGRALVHATRDKQVAAEPSSAVAYGSYSKNSGLVQPSTSGITTQASQLFQHTVSTATSRPGGCCNRRWC